MNEPSDDDVVTWWGLVIEGYHATRERLMGEIHRRYGLAPATFDVLVRLRRTAGCRLPMTRLAREAALSSGGFTKVADRMAGDGLIRREPSAADRRVIHAVLTDAGRDLADRALVTCAEVLREVYVGPLGTERACRVAEDFRVLRTLNTPDHPFANSSVNSTGTTSINSTEPNHPGRETRGADS